jgi:transposase
MPQMSRDLTDSQWAILDAIIPEPLRRRDGRGRPWRDRRNVLNGILWVLRTGAPWADVLDRYPSYQTCHRRFQQWVRSGVMKGILEALALELKVRGVLDVEEAFIDGSFAPAKKGDRRSGKRSAAKERRSWQWQIVMASPSLSASIPLPKSIRSDVQQKVFVWRDWRTPSGFGRCSKTKLGYPSHAMWPTRPTVPPP